MRQGLAAALLVGLAPPAIGQIPSTGVIEVPSGVVVDGVPPLPAALAEAMRSYTGGNRTSASTETRYPSPTGDIMIIQKDADGDELYQLYALQNGRLTRLTDGKAYNLFGGFSSDGRLIAFTSAKRNGIDPDFYVMDPRDPASARLVAAVDGGSWEFECFRPGDTHAIVANYTSYENRDLYDLDITTGKLTPLARPGRDVLFVAPRITSTGTLWVLSDDGSDVLRLGTLRAGSFSPVTPEHKWPVEAYRFVPGGRIAYVVNEGGASKLHLLDLKTRQRRSATLPVGIIRGLAVRGDKITFNLSGAQLSGGTFSVDPDTMAVTRTGGTDRHRNAPAELVTIRSFDGEPVSGFLYRPDPARFPGKRPLLVHIHGGPVSQSRPGDRGIANYYTNELGVAMFYPNVRGSEGYGRRFRTLDNGPWKREDAVKDIGAFLDHFSADAAIDVARIGVQGPSYGGYMCYASAIHYGARLKGAYCYVAVAELARDKSGLSRRSRSRAEYGDERDPKQRAKLLAISPLTNAARLRIPLLVMDGGEDPRVPAAQGELMTKAVRAAGGDVWRVLARDEGHGVYFSRTENRNFQAYVALDFWQRHLLR
ncbi:S9 family peptidase [Sphingomonas sp.]|uniref:S9 family peptidase n=1 Tax=Sphingomonas sp. TaxID=28214 RepID=UPI002DD64E39|nr:prolyl oligopeptidase family serine peptidase [Sphingomonas sp.]